MIVFPIQIDGFRISKIGDRTLTLHTYEEYADEVAKMTNGPMGTEYIAMFIKAENKEELEQFKNETAEETKERFRKRMNALIGELATIRGERAEKIREDLKRDWKLRGIIKESTTELDVPGYAGRITELLKTINEYKT